MTCQWADTESPETTPSRTVPVTVTQAASGIQVQAPTDRENFNLQFKLYLYIVSRTTTLDSIATDTTVTG